MTSMVANLAIILGSMQLSKRIDWENKDVLLTIRCVYLASNLIIFALFAYIYTRIQKRNGMSISNPPNPRSNSVEVCRCSTTVLTRTAPPHHHNGARIRHFAVEECCQVNVYGYWHDGIYAFVYGIYTTITRTIDYAPQDRD